MKNRFTFVLIAIVAVVLMCYMFIFQVRYDQVAIKTTFDRATEDSIIREPGSYFCLPPPIQRVTRYQTTIQILEDQLEEQQTADGYAVIVRTYLAWRIDDPLKFYIKLHDFQNAQEQLRPLLRDNRGIISKYRFDQLVNLDPAQLKLTDIEQESAQLLQQRINDQQFGIKVERVGLRRILLPESVTEKVFARMKENREALAEQARAEGRAKAAAIKSEAESAKKRILAFAERRAQAIRAEGEREAAEHYGKFAQNEQFAIFLRQLEALKTILAGGNTTFIFDPNELEALSLFKSPALTAPAPGAAPKAAN